MGNVKILFAYHAKEGFSLLIPPPPQQTKKILIGGLSSEVQLQLFFNT